MFTTIMYHYVRDLKRSRYPAIKGRSVETFKGQVEYIKRHYHVLTIDEVIAALDEQVGRLRALLERPQLLLMPGCHDALSARLIEEAGFEAACLHQHGNIVLLAGRK